jgi:hypothetical protein
MRRHRGMLALRNCHCGDCGDDAISSGEIAAGSAMGGRINARLKELGIELPMPAAPVANYVPFAASGNLVFIAGQIWQRDGERRHVGNFGDV